MTLLVLLLCLIHAEKLANDFLHAIHPLDKEIAVGGTPLFEMDFICNPTPCPRSLKCVGNEKCCDEGEWDCCGDGKDGLKKREYCPSESPWNVMCADGTCEKHASDCCTRGGVKYAGRHCSCNPTKCQHGLTCLNGKCCNKDDWDCCGDGDEKYSNRFFCPVGQIMCNNGFCVDAEDKCDSKGGIRFPKEVCEVHRGGPCNFATCEGGMTCFNKKTGKFSCCAEGDLDCCGEKSNRLFCPKGLAMCMNFNCLETNRGCHDKSAKHGGVRYSNQMCKGGLEMLMEEESVGDEEFEPLVQWDDAALTVDHVGFTLEGLGILVIVIFALVLFSHHFFRKRTAMDQSEPLIRNA